MLMFDKFKLVLERTPDMPARVIPEERAHYWAGLGKRPAEIRDALLAEGYRGITNRAISLWMGRRGYPKQQPARYADLLPWKVEPQHQNLYVPMMLRLLGRRRTGVVLTPEKEQALGRFLKRLRDLNAVVYYDPETEQGWFLVPREDEDKDIIRRPKDANAA